MLRLCLPYGVKESKKDWDKEEREKKKEQREPVKSKSSTANKGEKLYNRDHLRKWTQTCKSNSGLVRPFP